MFMYYKWGKSFLGLPGPWDLGFEGPWPCCPPVLAPRGVRFTLLSLWTCCLSFSGHTMGKMTPHLS